MESAVSTSSEIVVRRARPDDASIAAYLVRMSFHSDRAADWVFGLGDPDLARRALQRFFVRNGNRFSYEYASVAEVGTQVVGLVLGYDARTMRRANLHMAFQAPFLYGIARTLRLAVGSIPLLFAIPKPGMREFFVHNLAVLPAWRSHGIGTRLLAAAEEAARAKGLVRCSLDVALDNPEARAFYERRGYRVVATYRLKGRHLEHDLPGVHRMVKAWDLSPGQGDGHTVS